MNTIESSEFIPDTESESPESNQALSEQHALGHIETDMREDDSSPLTDDFLPTAQPPRAGCADLVLALLLLPWIGGLTLLAQPGTAIMGQLTVATGREWNAWILPAASSVLFVLLLVPLVPLMLLWKTPRYRAIFQTWALATCFILFQLPHRFILPMELPDISNGVALLQIAGCLVYAGFLALFIRFGKRRAIEAQRSLWPALLFAPLLIGGWLVWLTAGSLIDTVLGLLTALSFGYVTGLLCGYFLLPALNETDDSPGRNMLLGGYVVGGVLTIMGAAFGFQAQSAILMGILPLLGWLLLGLMQWGYDAKADAPKSNWPLFGVLVGIVTAAPLVMLDADELIVLLAVEKGELFSWLGYAALTTIGTGLVMGLLLVVLRHQLPRWGSGVGIAIAASILWLAVLALHVVLGRPGFHGDRLFVIMNEQADLSAANAISDHQQRRHYVYETLIAQTATQTDLRAALEQWRYQYTPYYLVNAIEVEGGWLTRFWLENRHDVDRVLSSPQLRPLYRRPGPASDVANAPTTPAWNLTAIGADRVWAELGVRGAGIVIGQSDSGVQFDHPELAATYRGAMGDDAYDHNYNWLDPWSQTIQPVDVGGHGTHTLGSVVGQSVGVAPDAQWYACANLQRNFGTPALYLACMQFMLAPFPLNGDPLTEGDPTRGANVLNNSWGCPAIEGCDVQTLETAIDALDAAGVFVVASAGNDGVGGCSTVRDPIAIYASAFSVGALAESGQIAEFSSRGPVQVDGSGRTKPDILAPGVEVLSAFPNNTYSFANGTSMAGPHVAGVVALLWSANPALIGDNERTRTILIETAAPYDVETQGQPACGESTLAPDNAVGYGIVDAYAAVVRTLSEK